MRSPSPTVITCLAAEAAEYPAEAASPHWGTSGTSPWLAYPQHGFAARTS